MDEHREDEGPWEIALVGDLTEHESDITEKILAVPHGGQCTLYFDSPGGSAYTAVALLTLIRLRQLDATGIVLGECSSAALWPFAACRHRFVTRWSVLLFHPMKWQSEENVALPEASEWARHFGQLEQDMDRLLADFLGLSHQQLSGWMRPGRYVGGPEVAEAGLAQLVSLEPGTSPLLPHEGSRR